MGLPPLDLRPAQSPASPKCKRARLTLKAPASITPLQSVPLCHQRQASARHSHSCLVVKTTLHAMAVHIVSSVKQICRCKPAVSMIHYTTPTVSPIVTLHHAMCGTYVEPHAVNIAYLREDLCIEGGDMSAEQYTFSFAAQRYQMTCASMSYTIS